MKYKIPLFDLNFGEEEKQAVLDVMDSRWISTGPVCEQFESKFAKMLGVNHAVTTANCTVALHLALRLLGIKEDDEVICPSLTFVATVNAIKYVGANPVFCDVISIEDLTVDPDEMEKLITSKTKAIIVMHFAGFSCDMDRIMRIAKKNNIKVIEDACHAPLSEFNGKKLGSIGDIGCYSFFSNKNISTGEGGMLITNDQSIADKAKLLRSHGMTSMSYQRSKGHATAYDVVEFGYNYRMDDMRASIGLAQLSKIQNDLEKRSLVRSSYVEKLQEINRLAIPFHTKKDFVSNYIFPIVLKDSVEEFRDQVRDHLHSCGIQTSVHYPAAHRFSVYENQVISLPVTEYVSDNLITLPMYSALGEDQISFITESLREGIGE